MGNNNSSKVIDSFYSILIYKDTLNRITHKSYLYTYIDFIDKGGRTV